MKNIDDITYILTLYYKEKSMIWACMLMINEIQKYVIQRITTKTLEEDDNEKQTFGGIYTLLKDMDTKGINKPKWPRWEPLPHYIIFKDNKYYPSNITKDYSRGVVLWHYTKHWTVSKKHNYYDKIHDDSIMYRQKRDWSWFFANQRKYREDINICTDVIIQWDVKRINDECVLYYD